MAAGIPAGLSKAAGRKFGLTVGIAFIALSGLLWWRHPGLLAVIASSLGGVLALAGLLIPTKLGPVERGWMAMAHAISKVTTPIVMGIVYYVVVMPIGLAVRVLGRNPLVHRPSEDGSFWVVRTAERAEASDMKRQF